MGSRACGCLADSKRQSGTSPYESVWETEPVKEAYIVGDRQETSGIISIRIKIPTTRTLALDGSLQMVRGVVVKTLYVG